VEIAFDPGKDAINRQKHVLSLADAALIDFGSAYVVLDERRAYGEARFQAYGVIAGRLYVLAFTMRGDAMRAISLRKANGKEVRRYGG
jgi:uncharacterized DUF497 family protein